MCDDARQVDDDERMDSEEEKVDKHPLSVIMEITEPMDYISGEEIINAIKPHNAAM